MPELKESNHQTQSQGAFKSLCIQCTSSRGLIRLIRIGNLQLLLIAAQYLTGRLLSVTAR